MTENSNAKAGSAGKGTWLMIIGVLLMSITSQAANYGNNLVLPSKLEYFNITDLYSLFATLSDMGMMISLPLVGMLSGKFGVKRVALSGMILQFVIRFILMYVPNAALFAVLWVLMGIASGLYISAPFTIMATLVPREKVPKFYGYIATASAIGSLVGPGLTGAVIDAVSPNAGLIIYGIFAIIPLLTLGVLYPNRKKENADKSFDFAGIFLLVVFVCCIILWLCMAGSYFELASVPGIVLPVAAVLALILLIKTELKVKNPSVPIHMFHKKRFRAAFSVQALMVAYSTCITAYAVNYVVYYMQGSSFQSSTVTMPQTIVQAIVGMFVGTIIGKQFKKRFRPLALLALALYIIALIILSTLQPDSSMIVIYVATAIGGISQALTQSLNAPFFQSELQPEEIAPAQGMFQFSSTGGASIFGAVCGAFINFGATFNDVFLLGAAFVGAALVIAIFTFRFPKEEMNA